MILINGKSDDRILISDRGLQYGDGLFETIAYQNGIAEFIDAHIERLLLGCKCLSIPFHEHEHLRSEIDYVISQLGHNNKVIKIIVTRGSGGRGYVADNTIIPTRIISTHDFPNYPENNKKSGVRVRYCTQTVSENKQLAGIKHLNRLEQVLARNEWNDSDIAEGLMMNINGNIIEGTMSNVFIVKSGQLKTPEITMSGIAGIMRSQIIHLANDNGLLVDECILSKQDIQTADEVFICNSIIGIWPVNEIEYKSYSVGSVTKVLQTLLLQAPK